MKINYNDIFKYVVGDSACPVERSLGPDYEVMEDFIYDCKAKKMTPQGDEFVFFMKNMENLRNSIRCGATSSRAEIIKLCKKIEEIGDFEVKHQIGC